jgi:hypothetical protein
VSATVAGRSAGRFAILAALALATTLASPRPLVSAQEGVIDREPEIKAAYLYNFGRYVEWPAENLPAGGNASGAFVIGVVGETSVLTPLRTIAATKKVAGRPITLVEIKGEADYRPCQLLFIPAGQDPEFVNSILKKARATATLVVGEDEGFAVKHGHIGFYVEQNNMKFEINSLGAEKSGLKISSKLLSLGRIVGDRQGN